MTQRNMLALSAGITVFVLVLIAAALGYSARPNVTTEDSNASNPVNLAPTSIAGTGSSNSQLEALVDQQIADYRQRLEEADQQLRQANTQLQEAYDKLNLLAASSSTPPAASTNILQPVPPAAPTPAVYTISPEQAVAIALKLAPGSSLTRSPELVNFRSAVAYEVQLDLGIIYIDANTSHVLYNGTAPLATGNPSPLLNVESGENQDHEGGEGDDD
jgi:hypothetical protein